MINNKVKAEHLGGGVVICRGALGFDQDTVVGMAEDLCAKEQDKMYTLTTHPETGEKTYLNKSGYFFDFDMVEKMPRRASAIHQDHRQEVIEFLQFLETAKDEYLLQYLEMFPIAFKSIWWKVKGHIVSYKPDVYLGVHSDTSVDYVYGIDEPTEQLATRSTVSCLVYFNNCVEDDLSDIGTNFTRGHHYFSYLDIDIAPRAGDILFFPANYMAAHEVLPVGKGVRYSYLGWYSHGTPNSATNEHVVDPIKLPELAATSTNVYMPTLRDDFRQHVINSGNSADVVVPGMSFY